MAQFERGNFQTYRATTKIHIGKYKIDILEDDEFEYDGMTVKVGPDEYSVTLLRAAYEKGWIVPSSDTTSRYVPQPAGVTVRPADTGNPNDYRAQKHREANSRRMGVDAVDHEEKVVGGGGFTDFSDPANKNRKVGRAGAGRMTVESADQEAEVVATVTPLAKRGETTAIVDNAAVAQKQASNLGSKLTKARPVRSGTPTPAIDTSNLSEAEEAQLRALLAKSGGGNAPAEVDDDYEPPADAPWIKKQTASEKAAIKAEADAARNSRLASMGIDAPEPAPAPDEGVIVEDADGVSLFEEDAEDDGSELDDLLADDPPAAPEVDPAEALLQQKMEMIRALMPDFDWDLTLQWKARVKLACTKYGANKPYLNAIKQIETPTVVKYINQFESKQ